MRGYPTIKYFTAETGPSGEAYNGGRSFDQLKEFVEDKLAGGCTVGSEADTCDEKEIPYIEKMKAKGEDAIAKELGRLAEMLKTAKMAADKKKWMVQRLNILKQL